MVGGVASSVAKIVWTSLLVLIALVLLIIAITITISVKNRQGSNYIDMNSGSVPLRQVIISPNNFHMRRIFTRGTARVEINYMKGPGVEVCIKRSSAVVSKTISKKECEYFHIMNKDSEKSITFTLGSGNFDLFLNNKARFRSTLVKYSVEVMP